MDADAKSREGKSSSHGRLDVMVEIITTALRTETLIVMLRLPGWATIVIARVLGERRVAWLAVRLPRAGVVSVLERLRDDHLISAVNRAAAHRLLALLVRLPQQDVLTLLRRLPDQEVLDFSRRLRPKDLSALGEPIPADVSSAVARRLYRRDLVELIQRLAKLGPMGAIPGWTVGALASTGDPLISFRRDAWSTLSDQGEDGRVQVQWLGGNKVWAYPGNEICASVVVEGCYEPNEMFFLDSVLRPGMRFVDIGANIGLYSLFAAWRVGDSGQVTAIEPSRREFQRLVDNIQLSRSNNIRPMNVAITDQVGEAQLSVAIADYAGHNTLGSFGSDSVTLDYTERVSTTTVDELAPSLGRVDVLKLDVEGAEFVVLRGAEATLVKWHPIVLFELFEAALVGQDASARDVLDFLQSLGYELYLFDRLSGRLAPLRETDGPCSSNLVAMFR